MRTLPNEVIQLNREVDAYTQRCLAGMRPLVLLGALDRQLAVHMARCFLQAASIPFPLDLDVPDDIRRWQQAAVAGAKTLEDALDSKIIQPAPLALVRA